MVKSNIKDNLGRILVEKIPKKRSKNYGIIDFCKDKKSPNKFINLIQEKPNPSESKSNYRVVGRYILPREIFSKLLKQKPGKGGEIHITDAIQTLIQNDKKFIAHNFSGKYLDCGSMSGYIKSTLEIAKS